MARRLLVDGLARVQQHAHRTDAELWMAKPMTAEQLDMIGDRLEQILREIAIPKPPRIAEKYASLTLSIVLLREQVMAEDTPANRKIVVDKELCELIKKRIEIEEHFEGGSACPQDDAHAGGA